MSRILAMFPGQGSQHVGMGKDLIESFPQARKTFEEASDAAGIDILKLCLEGPEEQLMMTANTQPCILAASVAVWRVLRDETGLEPAMFAGHSLGEYSAVVAAGRLDLPRAAFLVRKRGEAMQQAVPAGIGAMAAVINPPVEELLSWCENSSSADSSVQVVNYNSPQQVVIAGHKKAVEQICQQLESKGVRFVMLPVSAPFHSRLMSKAREEMTPLLSASEFKQNKTTVIANLTGKATTEYTAEYLIKQIDSPVLWTQTMTSASEAGCQTFVEIGPGKVLAGLGRRSVGKEAKFITTVTIREAISALGT